MIVQAKCNAPAWDSGACCMFTPGGGPLPGGLYEIEHDGQLASLKIGSSFVFTFDRTMAGTGQLPALGGFKCKQCNRVFETLNAIGTHTREEHRTIENEAIQDEPVFDRTCKVPGCGKVLANPYGLRLHMEKSHPDVSVEPGDAVPDQE